MAVRSAVALPDEIIGPGVDALVALRPQTLKHLNNPNSVYRRVFEGWRAQIALVLKRYADEAACVRLPIATGASLLELVADEFETFVDTTPTKSRGYVVLHRTGAMPVGMIKKGTRFRLVADDTATPPIRSATYETTIDRVAPYGASSVTIPVIAQAVGTAANTPMIDSARHGVCAIADTLFDTFTVFDFVASGGSDNVDEDAIRREAKAFELGQYAPTLDAVTAGALRGTGVRYLSTKDVAQVVTNYAQVLAGNQPAFASAAFTSVVAADASWSTNSEWTNGIKQTVADDFQGFGCAVRFGTVDNHLARVEASVMLRDANLLNDTSEIDAAIQQAISDYFDLRPDWWTWKLAQLRAVIARADRRILTCTSAVVKVFSTNATMNEPTAPYATPDGYALVHTMVPPNAITTTYVVPT